MKMCERHWAMMRAAVEARGMTPLVSDDGQSAVVKLVEEIQQGLTMDTFDPLMAMNWNIMGNLMETLGSASFYLLSSGPEDLIDVAQLTESDLQAKYAGQTWPRCPICYANIAHEFSCREEKCMLSRVNGYDVCIEWSADAVKEQFDQLMGGTKLS